MKILMILSCSKTNLKIDVHVIKKKQNKLKTKKKLESDVCGLPVLTAAATTALAATTPKI